jgi:hypothetical protein
VVREPHDENHHGQQADDGDDHDPEHGKSFLHEGLDLTV